MTETKTRTEIEKAILHLAGQDPDLASELNGVGFNAFDGMFGHDLADKIIAGHELTEGQTTAALKMLKKYTGQLRSAGITLPKQLEFIEIKKQPVSITIETGSIMVRFTSKPSDAIRAAMKLVPSWRWRPELPGTPWSFPTSAADRIKAIFPDIEFPELVSAVSEISAKPLHQPQDIEFSAPAPVLAKTAEVTLTLHEGAILVHFGKGDNFQANLAKVKGLSERRWNPDLPGKPWVVPGRLASELFDIFPDAQVGDDLKDLLAKQAELTGMSRAADTEFDVPGMRLPLLPFQRAGVEFIEKAEGRAIVADEMGLGKTCQSLGYLQLHPEHRPAIIVVPASLKINWVREIAKFMTTKDQVHVINGGKTYKLALTGASIVIINYDVLSKWQEQIIAWKPEIMICDEAHALKNSKALRSKAGKALAGKINRVMLLTGTPVTNRPVELFPLLNMVAPNSWPNFYRYAVQYCDAQNNGFGLDTGGATNLTELHEKIKPYLVRRTKDQVMKELPEKRRATLVIDFDKSQKAAYENYIAEALKSVTQAEQLAWFEKAKQAAALGKIDAAIEWIENFLDTGKKLVVFCTHHIIIDKLVTAFPGAVKVDGRDSLDSRQVSVDRFQNDPAVNLFIGNIRAAGVGLTLTAASDVAFIEFDWTPGSHVQCEDRTHRIGQKDSVTAWYLVAEGTVDEDIVAMIEAKRQVIETIHDGKVSDQDFSIFGELLKKYTGKTC